MITHDFSSVFASLDRLPNVVEQINQAGVDTIAPTVRQAMQDTAAHGDISGASRGSYRALTATNAATETANGYAAASAALAGAPALYGQPVRQDTGIAQTDGHVVMVLTDYTSYGQDRETAEAGKRAVEGPTLQQFSQQITQAIAAASRQRLR